MLNTHAFQNFNSSARQVNMRVSSLVGSLDYFYAFLRGSFERLNSICDALHDLVPFVQFKKHEKHPWRSVTFSKVAGFQSATL